MAILLAVGCEAPWAEDDDALGSGTIQGNVSTLEINGVAILFNKAPQSGVLEQIAELLVPSAHAADNLGGITVYIRGLGLSATTDDAGNFIIFGVPAGAHELVFKHGDREVSYPVDVPEEGAVVEIVNVRLVENAAGLRVSVPEVRITTYTNGTPQTRVVSSGGSTNGDTTEEETADDSSGSDDSGTITPTDPGGWIEEEV